MPKPAGEQRNHPTAGIGAPPYRSYLTCGRVLRGLGRLPGLLAALGPRRILLVADRVAAERSGALPPLWAALRGRLYGVFDEFSPYPDLHEVMRGHALAARLRAELILAVGGGSALDLAKLISVVQGDPQRADAVLTRGGAIFRPGPPVVAIPTTAGTGAEVTHFAALYLDRVKVSLAHPSLRPVASLLDPLLTASMPPRLTATTGLDAVCQAVESLWSVRSTGQSRAYARRALALGLRHLPEAVQVGSPRARRALLIASHLAGRAIDITTTTACHAMSYVLTQEHHIPHGHAVALTLPEVLRRNAAVTADNCVDPRGPDHTRRVVGDVVAALGAGGVEQAARRFEAFMDELQCPRRLSDFGIGESDLPKLAGAVDPLRMSNNPCALDRAAVESIFRALLPAAGARAALGRPA